MYLDRLRLSAVYKEAKSSNASGRKLWGKLKSSAAAKPRHALDGAQMCMKVSRLASEAACSAHCRPAESSSSSLMQGHRDQPFVVAALAVAHLQGFLLVSWQFSTSLRSQRLLRCGTHLLDSVSAAVLISFAESKKDLTPRLIVP